MLSSLQKNALEHIKIVRILIDAHLVLLEQKEPDDRRLIKIFAVSSCVTRLYAVFEYFVETAISDYLDVLCENTTFDSLPDSFKNEYRLGISKILNKIGHRQYSSVSHEEVVRWYFDALSGNDRYRFVTKALTWHNQNFRLPTINSLFKRISLSNFDGWLSSHADVCALYPDNGSISEQLTSELETFIQLRNDASHGQMDSLEGTENLIRFCDLITAVINAISSFISRNLLAILRSSNKVAFLGKVSESFQRNGAFVAKIQRDIYIETSQRIILSSQNDCRSDVIMSLMIQGELVESAISDSDEFELGLKCSKPVRTYTEIYRHLIQGS